MTTDVVGAILAGGCSRRLGTDKTRITTGDGRTLPDIAATALAPLAAGLVVLGAPHVRPELRHLADLRPDHGPLGAIEALLASGLALRYVVCPCDLPFVTSETLAPLARPSFAPAARLHIEGEPFPRPLPARIDASALPHVRRALDAGRRAVHALLATLDAEIIEVPAAWARALDGVNTADDLERMREEMGSRD